MGVQFIGGQRLAELLGELAANVVEIMLAIEQREDKQRGTGNNHIAGDQMGSVGHSQQLLALPLDREHLHGA